MIEMDDLTELEDSKLNLLIESVFLGAFFVFNWNGQGKVENQNKLKLQRETINSTSYLDWK